LTPLGLHSSGVEEMAVAAPVNFLPWLRVLPALRRKLEWVLRGQRDTHAEYERIIARKEKETHDEDEEDLDVTSAFLRARARIGRSGLEVKELQHFRSANWNLFESIKMTCP
jgi:ecdysteroid 25-hydroxylase CYP306A1